MEGLKLCQFDVVHKEAAPVAIKVILLGLKISKKRDVCLVMLAQFDLRE